MRKLMLRKMVALNSHDEMGEMFNVTANKYECSTRQQAWRKDQFS